MYVMETQLLTARVCVSELLSLIVTVYVKATVSQIVRARVEETRILIVRAYATGRAMLTVRVHVARMKMEEPFLTLVDFVRGELLAMWRERIEMLQVSVFRICLVVHQASVT
jgi:hypothetical protein